MHRWRWMAIWLALAVAGLSSACIPSAAPGEPPGPSPVGSPGPVATANPSPTLVPREPSEAHRPSAVPGGSPGPSPAGSPGPGATANPSPTLAPREPSEAHRPSAVPGGSPGPSPEGSPSPAASVSPSPTPARTWWRPQPGLSWQWQLTGRLNLDLHTDVIDVDLYVGPSVVEHFHQQGTRVICYISVGSYENWRPDKDRFPTEVLGKDYEGWAGERWLDIRRIDLLAPIMRARLDLCASKGFDAVEPDNIMVYTEDTGFPISYQDNIRYALWLAEEAHARGLAIGLKNGPEMVRDLVDVYDFAITEEAFYYHFARQFKPFVDQGKAVFNAEYTDTDVDWDAACRQSRELGFSTILKHRELDAWVQFCP